MKNRLNKGYFLWLEGNLFIAFCFSWKASEALRRHEEFILLKFFNRYPLFWVDFKYFAKDISKQLKGLLSNGRIMSEFHLLNIESLCAFRVDFILHVDAFEGKVSKEHAEEENSHCPDIHLIIVNLFFEDLWGHIRCGSAESVDILIILSAKS